ncbi:Aspartokinase [Irineochytrium annulatum]|nr:Aspartokinase [Irineochytrium annulatum]
MHSRDTSNHVNGPNGVNGTLRSRRASAAEPAVVQVERRSGIIVQKFGGTSVGSAERMNSVASIVKASMADNRIIVVLSAMSSYVKAEGTTSMLLEAAEDILLPNSNRYLDIVSMIEQNHLRAIKDAISSEKIRAECERDVRADCERLRSFMSAAEIIDEISPRSKDIIIGTGERLSARIFTSVLEDKGIKATYVNLAKLVTKQFELKSLDQSFYDYLTDRLAATVRTHDPPDSSGVLVVTGFLGPVPGSILSTIGRGYTDLTAALIAVGTGADELQIWKEVDGIFTADPRKVKRARLLPTISPEEAAELTYYGSEVIHPFTMEQVIRAAIPIRIKNTFVPSGAGTLILPNPGRVDVGSDVDMSSKHATAATIKDNITVLNVHSNRKSVSHGFFAQIFSTLDRFGIVVDLISTSEVHVSMALGPNITAGKLDAALVELRKYGTVDVLNDMAILSLVGREMRNTVGIASRMFATLAENKVNIEMISQGASEINISCVIEESMAVEALRAVHDACILT